MSPNDVKAIKLCAELMGADLVGYNPIKNKQQADELAARFGLEVHESTTAWSDVYCGEKVVGRFSGFTKNAAIVNTACSLHDPKWSETELYGIDFRFSAEGWKDAAGPA